MNVLHRLSIRAKLVVLFMAASTLAMVLASGGVLAWDFVQQRESLRRELSSQARLVLENSTAAIAYHDVAAAEETLRTLAPNPSIRAACLYDPGGVLFAAHGAVGHAQTCPATAPAVGSMFSRSGLEVTEATQVAGAPAGLVYLRSDLNALTSRLKAQAVAAAVALLVTLGIAYLVSVSLQQVVSRPIEELAATARRVSSQGDYSVRARKTTDDELGLLVDAFNGMLDHIDRAQRERTALLQREREANRLKDDFLMTLSHELRTPLNAILGWTRMLTARMLPTEATERALQKIERNAQAQARLVEDLLEVARFTTGKVKLRKEQVDFATIVDNALEAVRPDAEGRRIEFERRYAVSSVTTVGDPDRLQQVVWNLLTNAVKFSPDGSRIFVGLRRSGDDLELVVRDAGIGIAPEFLPHVFDSFRQADASSTRTYGGLGLGLSIVRRITEMHGGHVEADSPGLGLGTTMTIRLPLRDEGRTTEALSDVPSLLPEGLTATLSGARVLVVDDDTDTREMLQSLLEGVGASVQVAASAAEALQRASEDRPDVLISDIAMPGQDGFVLIDRLRALLGPDLPIAVALTARASDVDRREINAAGFVAHVVKPFDPVLLVKLLRDLVVTKSESE